MKYFFEEWDNVVSTFEKASFDFIPTSLSRSKDLSAQISRVQTYDIINMNDKTRMHIQTVTVVPQFNRLSSDEKTQATYPTNSCKYSLKLLKIPR